MRPLQNYRAKMLEIAQSVLKLLALALPGPAPASLFDEFMVEPSGNLRLLHYPPKAAASSSQQLGCKLTWNTIRIHLLIEGPRRRAH